MVWLCGWVDDACIIENNDDVSLNDLHLTWYEETEVTVTVCVYIQHI